MGNDDTSVTIFTKQTNHLQKGIICLLLSIICFFLSFGTLLPFFPMGFRFLSHEDDLDAGDDDSQKWHSLLVTTVFMVVPYSILSVYQWLSLTLHLRNV